MWKVLNKEVQYQDLPLQWLGNGKMVFAKLKNFFTKLIFFPPTFFCSERFPFSKVLAGKKSTLQKSFITWQKRYKVLGRMMEEIGTVVLVKFYCKFHYGQ
jgi:hypothetical protein